MKNREIELSPAVQNLQEWCINRIRGAGDRVNEAVADQRKAHAAVGEGMRELREDASVSVEELAERMQMGVESRSSMMNRIEVLEAGRGHWFPDFLERYVASVGEIYLEKSETK